MGDTHALSLNNFEPSLLLIFLIISYPFSLFMNSLIEVIIPSKKAITTFLLTVGSGGVTTGGSTGGVTGGTTGGITGGITTILSVQSTTLIPFMIPLE